MLTAVLALTLPANQPAVELYRQWKEGTTLSFQVTSKLMTEQRDYNTSIFIPDSQNQDYNFTFLVKKVSGEGFATVEYKRPYIDITFGETADSAPVTKKEEVNE